jgi:hypothetical protein
LCQTVPESFQAFKVSFFYGITFQLKEKGHFIV